RRAPPRCAPRDRGPAPPPVSPSSRSAAYAPARPLTQRVRRVARRTRRGSATATQRHGEFQGTIASTFTPKPSSGVAIQLETPDLLCVSVSLWLIDSPCSLPAPSSPDTITSAAPAGNR